jgi:hypothetical protein
MVVVEGTGSGCPKVNEGAGPGEAPEERIVVVVLMMNVTKVVSLLLTVLGILAIVNSISPGPVKLRWLVDVELDWDELAEELSDCCEAAVELGTELLEAVAELVDADWLEAAEVSWDVEVEVVCEVEGEVLCEVEGELEVGVEVEDEVEDEIEVEVSCEADVGDSDEAGAERDDWLLELADDDEETSDVETEDARVLDGSEDAAEAAEDGTAVGCSVEVEGDSEEAVLGLCEDPGVADVVSVEIWAESEVSELEVVPEDDWLGELDCDCATEPESLDWLLLLSFDAWVVPSEVEVLLELELWAVVEVVEVSELEELLDVLDDEGKVDTDNVTVLVSVLVVVVSEDSGELVTVGVRVTVVVVVPEGPLTVEVKVYGEWGGQPCGGPWQVGHPSTWASPKPSARLNQRASEVLNMILRARTSRPNRSPCGRAMVKHEDCRYSEGWGSRPPAMVSRQSVPSCRSISSCQ